MSISVPTDISGCKLWLQGNLGLFDATSGGSAVSSDGTAVLRWEDQSGQGNHFTEATATPTKRNSGVNGAASVRFTSASSQRLSLAHASAGPLNTLQNGSYTVVLAVQLLTLAANGTWLAKGGSGDHRMYFFSPGAGTGFERLNAFGGYYGGNGNSTFIAAGVPYIITYTFQLTGTNTGVETLRVNGLVLAQRTGSVPAVNTTVAWTIGCGTSGSPAFFYNGDIAAAIMYDSVLSSTQIADIEGYLRTYLSSSFPTYEAGVRIVTEGDSITFGVGSTGGLNWPTQMMTLLNRPIMVQNAAVSSTTITTTLPIFTRFSAVDTLSIYTVFSGTNGINVGGETDVTMYAKLQTHCANARAAGYDKIVVFTCLPRTAFDATKEGYRLGYNTAIRNGFANRTLECDAVADVAANSTIGDDPDAENLTYYTDGTHPTNAGYAIIAQIAADAIQPFITPASSVDDRGVYYISGVEISNNSTTISPNQTRKALWIVN